MVVERTDWQSKLEPHRKSGWVKWVAKGKVCFCFSKTNRDKTKTYEVEDFLRLYERKTK